MSATRSEMITLGSKAPGFNLPNTNPGYGGDPVSLADFSGKPVLVIFMCNHCPYVIHIVEKLAEIARSYQPEGLCVIGISANDISTHPQDAPEKMTQLADKHGFTFPYLFDESQQTAIDYGAVCTPDLFLYDHSHELVYHGQFDDSRPGNGDSVTGADVIKAIEGVLTGAAVPSPQKPSVGCSIKWKVD